jgi:hypothetical protein
MTLCACLMSHKPPDFFAHYYLTGSLESPSVAQERLRFDEEYRAANPT